MNGAGLGLTVAVTISDRTRYKEEQEVAMAESATHTTEHVTEDQNGPAAVVARDEQNKAAQARRARQMALVDGVMRDYEPVLRELGQR